MTLPFPTFAQDEDLLDLDNLGDYESNPDKSTQAATLGGVSAIFTGRILTKAAQDLRKDNDQEFLFSDLTYASAKTAVTLSPKFAITIEGLFEYQIETNGEDTQGEYRMSLWEGTAKWKLGPIDLTIGQQRVAWGLAGLINPTDIVNPRDYDRLLDSELGLTKLPAPMTRLEWYLPKNLKIDVVALPFFVPARFSIVGRDVALFAHNFPLFFLLADVKNNPDWRLTERALDLWYPSWEHDLDALLEDEKFFNVRTQSLDQDFTHAEGALRFSGRTGPVDYSASYMFLWDDIPTLYVNPEFLDLLSAIDRNPDGYSTIPRPSDIDPKVLLEPFSLIYHRTHAVGADFGTSIGGVGLRAEGLYSFVKRLYTQNMRVREKPVANYVFNIDYMFDKQFLITCLFMGSSMIDYHADMLMPPTYSILMLAMRKPWLNDKLTTELAAAYDFSYLTHEQWRNGDLFGEDGMITPMVSYAILDPLKISLGANVVFGDPYRLFGILRDNTRAFTTLKYDF